MLTPIVEGMTARPALRQLTVVLALLVSGSGCGSGGAQQEAEVSGDVATWTIDNTSPPRKSATSFRALVKRLGCASGETGEVHEPMVTFTEQRIVVTFTVEPLPPGGYDCPSNDEVERVVDLGQEVGRRQIVDGACLEGEATSTSSCADGPVRWSP